MDQLKLFAEEVEENQKDCQCDDAGSNGGSEAKDAQVTNDKKKKELPDYPRIVCYAGRQKTYDDTSISLEDIRKDLQKLFPELRPKKTEMQYEVKKKQKLVMVYPVIKAAKGGC